MMESDAFISIPKPSMTFRSVIFHRRSADYKQIGRRCLVFVAQEYRHLILKYACYKIKLKVIGKYGHFSLKG